MAFRNVGVSRYTTRRHKPEDHAVRLVILNCQLIEQLNQNLKSELSFNVYFGSDISYT